MQDKEKAKQIIAKTVYNEARGQGKSGMDAVGETMQNRHDKNKSYYGGQDYSKICSNAYVGAHGKEPNPTNNSDKAAYDHAQKVAEKVINHQMGNTTQGATHFDAKSDSFKQYDGKSTFTPTTVIGDHHFFKEK